MHTIDPKSWKADLPAFIEKTDLFYNGELDKNAYKGFSGLYGSYAQKGGKASMLRLRMPTGQITKAKMAYIANAIKNHGVKKVHFTTCQAVQLHDLTREQLYPLMEEALDTGIVIMGGGGDFPRNTMCTPLSGTQKDEYFDVRPYALAAGEYCMNFIKAEKMPRKLKICFSSSPENVPHATYRDLGFVAREDGLFDVYSAGGLGNNARLGVKVAEAVAPEKVLYYIKAMWITFRTYGNYENRGKARTRYMQEICGSPEQYVAAYNEKLQEVFASGEDLDLTVEIPEITKKGDGTVPAANPRILEQKQEGLYTVVWHPLGGQPAMDSLLALNECIQKMEAAEVHLDPNESAYIVNLTASEALEVIAATPDHARSEFEFSVSCIGASICQVGVRDSQQLLADCVKAVNEAGIPDGALPVIHISGCPSSCGTHQTGEIGFRGAAKKVNGETAAAFVLFVGGESRQGQERFGEELGTIQDTKIPEFLVRLGKMIADTGMNYKAWRAANPGALEKLAEEYI
ncbi:MAG: nitrite/sulfite reductase [Lachnospiraceae bacterium]|nr:nitrite/sulfite reductase [Lachnospiraceae bacterium]